MFSLLKNCLRATSKAPRAAARPAAPRPRVTLQAEALEKRDLMAAVVFTEPVASDVKTMTFAASESYEIRGKAPYSISTGADTDRYTIPIGQNALVSFENLAPDPAVSIATFVTGTGNGSAGLWQQGQSVDGKKKYVFAENVQSLDYSVTGSSGAGSYAFRVTVKTGVTMNSLRPDIEMLSASSSKGSNTVSFGYRVTDPIPDRVGGGQITMSLWGMKGPRPEDGMKFLTDKVVSGVSSKSYSDTFSLSGLNLTDFSHLRVVAKPLSWNESNSMNNNAQAVYKMKPDIRMDKVWVENGTKLWFTYEVTGKIDQPSARLQLVQSTDKTFGNDKFLGNISLSGSLLAEGKWTAGVTIGASGQIKIPGAGLAEVDGLYHLIVKADSDETIAESNETNNIAVMENPDIRAEKVAIQDGKISFTYEVTGWIPKEKAYVRLVQSTDASYSESDLKLDYFHLAGSQLAPGRRTVTRPIGTGAGQVRLPGLGLTTEAIDYYLVAKVDTENKLGEANETNNEVSMRPDVKISNVRFEKPGATEVKFEIAIRDIAKPITVWLYQSNSASFHKLSATIRSKITVEPTATKGVFDLAKQNLPPLSVSHGNYFYVVADPTEDLFETNEKNNVSRGVPDVDVVKIGYFGSFSQIAWGYNAWNLSESIDATLYQSDSPTFDRAASKILAQTTVSPQAITGNLVLAADVVRSKGRFLYLEMNKKRMSLESIQTNNVMRLEVPENVKADFLTRIRAKMDSLNQGSGLSTSYFSMGDSARFISVVEKYLKGVAIDPAFLNEYPASEGTGSLSGLTLPKAKWVGPRSHYDGWIVLRDATELDVTTALHEAVHAFHLGIGSDVDEDIHGGTEAVTSFFPTVVARMRMLDAQLTEVEQLIQSGKAYATQLDALRKSFALQKKIFDDREERASILAVLGNMGGSADFTGFQTAFEAKIAAALGRSK